jgi:hypothetical protein
VVYGCEAPWWRERKGLPQFPGLKLCYDRKAASEFPGVIKIEIRKVDLDAIVCEEPGVIGSGGNSGFQALNLAVQFGCTGILLIGFDMHDRSGLHWYGRNVGKDRRNPDRTSFRRWVRALEGSADVLASLGVDVVNASPSSDVKCFRRASIEQALRGWGL